MATWQRQIETPILCLVRRDVRISNLVESKPLDEAFPESTAVVPMFEDALRRDRLSQVVHSCPKVFLSQQM